MEIEQFSLELTRQFCGIWPSMRSTMSESDLIEYQAQMIRALVENGLNTHDAIARGFKNARRNGGQYPPSVPEFVRWCEKPISHRPEQRVLEIDIQGESTQEERKCAHKLIEQIKEKM